MQPRQKISSGASWEDIVGYCRAIKVGSRIHVAGTTATAPDGSIIGENDAYAQTVYIIRTIESALKEAGASLDHIVRTRMFVTDISRWQEYGRAHGEFFASIKPCATMVEVRSLIDPRHLIEMEVDAEL